MPRKQKNARRRSSKKRIYTKPNARVRLIWTEDDGMSPGRIRAVAEYIKN